LLAVGYPATQTATARKFELVDTVRLLLSRILFAVVTIASEAAVVKRFGATEISGVLLIVFTTSAFIVSVVASNLGSTAIPHALRVSRDRNGISEIFDAITHYNRNRYLWFVFGVVCLASLWQLYSTSSGLTFVTISALSQIAFCVFGGRAAVYTAQFYAERRYALPQLIRLITPALVIVACHFVSVAPEWVLILVASGCLIEYLVFNHVSGNQRGRPALMDHLDLARVSIKGYFLALGSIVVSLIPLVGMYILASRAPEASAAFVLGSRIPAFTLAFLGSVLGVTMLVDLSDRFSRVGMVEAYIHFDGIVKHACVFAVLIAAIVGCVFPLASRFVIPIVSYQLAVPNHVSADIVFVCLFLMMQVPFALISIVIGRIFCVVEKSEILTYVAIGTAAVFFLLLLVFSFPVFSVGGLCIALVGSQAASALILICEYVRRRRYGSLH
jgi:hypothetical protein